MASRNYYQGRQGAAPIDAVQHTNQEVLDVTPQTAINDSIRQHVPLQNAGMAGHLNGHPHYHNVYNAEPGTQDGYDEPDYPNALPQVLPNNNENGGRAEPIRLGSSAATETYEVPTKKRASLGSRMKKGLSFGKSSPS